MIIQHGDTIVDFRGDEWIFDLITRQPEPGKEGKIVAKKVENGWEQELYPSVFDMKIVDGQLVPDEN